jgi:hypothetical protein
VAALLAVVLVIVYVGVPWYDLYVLGLDHGRGG